HRVGGAKPGACRLQRFGVANGPHSGLQGRPRFARSRSRQIDMKTRSTLCLTSASAAVRTPGYLSVTLAGSYDGGCRDCCARLIDVHQRAAQTELTEVAIRSLDARHVLHVPRLHRVEAC